MPLAIEENDVIKFINEFYDTAVRNIIDSAKLSKESYDGIYEGIRLLYHSGYCYHFASILKSAFNRGRLVWMAPFSHMAWEDTDTVVYDCEGKYEGEAFYAIPIDDIGENVDSFTHTKDPSTIHFPSKDELISVIKKYCKDSGETYCPEIEEYLRDDM